MIEEVEKLCSDKTIHERFLRLYGPEPLEQKKAIVWRNKQAAFFMGYECGSKDMKEKVAIEIEDFFADNLPEYSWKNSKGEDFFRSDILKELVI